MRGRSLFKILFVVGATTLAPSAAQQDGRKGYHDPRLGNGSMLLVRIAPSPMTLNSSKNVPDTNPIGLGEPVNLIISGNSDARVLNPTQMHGGLYNYFEAFHYGGECFALHLGPPQTVNLGDGKADREALGCDEPQISMMRYQHFHDIYLGTCLQSIFGGPHFRLFHQYTTGAYFMASSVSKDGLRFNHDLVPDAYDTNRDWIDGNLTGQRVNRSEIAADHSTSGKVYMRGWEYTTTVNWDDTLLPKNRTAFNHYTNVQPVGKKVTDGWTAILTVKAVKRADSGV